MKIGRKIRVVCIIGPTAVGKSDFAVQYALKNNGEIISADSRQVYKGLDIGTGKITKKEMLGIPHYLLDVADPKKQFNVEKYRELSQKAILDISSRGKLPIICGGTGFYIDAVIKNISYPNVPYDKKFRKKLLKKDSGYLLKALSQIDENFVNSLNNSERNNKQRLIRFIEIGKTLGRIPKIKTQESPYDTVWIGLTTSLDMIKKRIHDRLLLRLKKGMIEEVQNLHKNGLSYKRMEELGLEYRYLARFLQKKISSEQMKKELEKEIWHYAKRQLVWWKRNKKIKWIKVK